MVIRIKFRSGPAVKREGRKNRHLALAAVTLLTPGVLTAAALGAWKLAADLRMAGQFAIADGLFSHWQVWLGVAGILQLSVIVLIRYGNDLPLFGHADKPSSALLDSQM